MFVKNSHHILERIENYPIFSSLIRIAFITPVCPGREVTRAKPLDVSIFVCAQIQYAFKFGRSNINDNARSIWNKDDSTMNFPDWHTHLSQHLIGFLFRFVRATLKQEKALLDMIKENVPIEEIAETLRCNL